MARTSTTFKQSDVVRAVRAVSAAGLHVVGVKIDPQTGKIEIVTGTVPAQDNFTPLDRWMAEHGPRQA
jgi:hypothetical protein